MATTEHIGLMTYKDENGNLHLLYPITTKDAVEGLDEIEALAKNAVPLDGSKAMTGALHFSADGAKRGLLYANAYNAIVSAYNADDQSNAHQLKIKPPSQSDINGGLVFSDIVDGNETAYTVHHTGNKPSGNYTGNGSAASRTIHVGGLGNWVAISSNNGIVIMSNGAIGATRTAVSAIPYEEGHYASGDISLATINELLNANGVSYYYRVF